VSAAVVERHDLNVDVVEASVLVDVTRCARQETARAGRSTAGRVRAPNRNLRFTAIWLAVPVSTTAIALLQKLLVFAFQLVIQDDTVDPGAAFLNAAGFALADARLLSTEY
jgi:hypothetical protein